MADRDNEVLVNLYLHRRVRQTSNESRSFQQLIAQHRDHMAWVLLASRNASLTLACLQTLFDNNQAPFAVKAVARKLAEAFTRYANDPQFDTDTRIRRWPHAVNLDSGSAASNSSSAMVN